MRYLIQALLLILLITLGGWVHEGDIQESCKNNGMSGGSTWRGELKCEPKGEGRL